MIRQREDTYRVYPIGLEGGINTYLYTNANPLKYSDPTGENPLLFGLGAAVAIRYGVDQLSLLLEAKWKVEELKQLVDLKNVQFGCINSGGRSCGDLGKTEINILTSPLDFFLLPMKLN